MASAPSVCMTGGDGETSYAKNSAMQSGVQSMLKPLVEEAISDLCGGAAGATPPCLRVADLGCSSGPNALALASAAVDAVRRCQPERRCREVCVYLNDLPNNDFNTVFKDVPPFLREHGDVPPLVMVFGAPGSFYGRLFPADTLHLVCSNFSLHWLSQVPQELVDGVLVNKGRVCAGRTSSPAVAAAYARQFEHDFGRFLAARAEEVVPGGRMVLSLWGRPDKDLASSQDMYPELIAEILQDMASRGVIPAEEVDAFNEPFYSPCLEEVRAAVEREGSFEVVAMESSVFTERGPRGDAERAKAMARSMRVLDEWLLVQHFRVEGVGDAYASAAEERFMGPAAEQDSTGAVLLVSLRRRK
ncbi:unnamed protein product [Urochloa decumbens]|uniref:Uncharacterized protein n=1 Tax=Urochloa decumbens TaxID=240449 RepID=A0ABC8XEQ7_9POAL